MLLTHVINLIKSKNIITKCLWQILVIYFLTLLFYQLCWSKYYWKLNFVCYLKSINNINTQFLFSNFTVYFTVSQYNDK